MTERPNWGWGERQPVPMFTEAEIRAVMIDHYPDCHFGSDISCACGPALVRRPRCFYCAAPVPENWRETQHRPKCKAEASGFRDMGVTATTHPDFTVDHLIECLKENREKHLAEHPCAQG